MLIPPEQYYLQGSTARWTATLCPQGTSTYVCSHHRLRTTACNLTKSTSCSFAHVTNNIKIFQLLNNLDILFFSPQEEVVIETCNRMQTSIQLKGPNLWYTNATCPISSMQITLEPQPVSYIKHFSLPYVPSTPIVTHEVEFHYSHLDVNKLKSDLQPLAAPTHVYTYLAFSYIFYFIIFVCFICYMFKQSILSKLKGICTTAPPVTEDSDSRLGGEESCATTQRPPHTPERCFAFAP